MVLSQIVALLTRVRFPVSEFVWDVVAEWLTRSTANRFLSGAQVRVLPTSFIFLFGRCGAKAACETSDLLIGVQFPAPSLEVFSSFGFGGSNPPLRLCGGNKAVKCA